MNSTIFFSVVSLLYCLLLIVTLYSNENIKGVNNKILKILAFINCGNLLFEVSGIFLGSNYEKFELLNDIILRAMLVFYIAWFTFYIVFVLNIAREDEKFVFEKNKILYMIMIVCIALVIFLPITAITNEQNVIIYSTGLAVQVVYYYILASNFACLAIMFKNAKKIKVINYSSLFALIVLSTLSAAIQSYYPSVLLTASAETFVLYIAYIRIRNGRSKEVSDIK